MNVAEDVEREEQVAKPPKLRLLTGGKGPPDPPEPPWTAGINWLGDLEQGTTFVARSRNSKEVDYNLYYVLFTSEKVVLLKWQLPDGKMLDYYVDPERFSKQFLDYVILGVHKEEPKRVEESEHADE